MGFVAWPALATTLAPAIALITPPAPLAFGPIYVVAIAVVVGAIVIALMGRAPSVTEPAMETATRGKADHPMIAELDGSVEAKVRFLVHMGFKDIELLVAESKREVSVFHVQNPMPLSGGGYLIHFLHRRKVGDVVPSTTVLAFISEVKHTEDVMKGILVTSGAFSQAAWGVLEKAPIELIDGKHLLELMKLWHPERFPRDRV